MALVDATGAPIQPQLDQNQMMQLMTGLRIRIDAANAQLVQLGLLVEYLYEELGKRDIEIDMETFPKWAEQRYTEIQAQAKEAMEQSKEEVDKIKESLKEELGNVAETVAEQLNQQDELSKVRSTKKTARKKATTKKS